MARQILLTSGSIMAGNPITFIVTPEYLSVTPSFHRIITEVICGLSGGNYEIIKLSTPVAIEGNDVEFDVSSAIRVPFDAYEYSPEAAQYPFCSWQLKVYDEYMTDNGEVHTYQGVLYYPSKDTYYRSIAGGFSDIERFLSEKLKNVKYLSHKPTTVPHLAFVGEQIAYTPSYATEQSLIDSGNLDKPESKVETITKEGQQTIGGQSVYALPATEANTRQVFRFINSFGVLESISVPRVYSKNLSVTSNSYMVAILETFNKFSRSSIKKKNDQESWLFQSDPLNEEWLSWYLHEFLMSEHIWMDIQGNFIPCTITPEENTTFLTRTESKALTVSFTAKLGINGSPIL